MSASLCVTGRLKYTTRGLVDWFFDFWCLNATFNNISAISWRPLWWRKPEYPKRTTDHGQATGKLYHLRLRVECTLFCSLSDEQLSFIYRLKLNEFLIKWRKWNCPVLYRQWFVIYRWPLRQVWLYYYSLPINYKIQGFGNIFFLIYM